MLLNNLSIYNNIVIEVPFKSINLIEEKLHETDRLYSSSPIIFDYSTETYSTESSLMEHVCHNNYCNYYFEITCLFITIALFYLL